MSIHESIFIERLKELIKQKGLEQKQLGERIGVPQQTINSWFRGQATPKLSKLCELADALNVSLDYLVGRSDDPKVRRPKTRTET
jgi:transcriptional regulator with XRE-family HTH domain